MAPKQHGDRDSGNVVPPNANRQNDTTVDTQQEQKTNTNTNVNNNTNTNADNRPQQIAHTGINAAPAINIMAPELAQFAAQHFGVDPSQLGYILANSEMQQLDRQWRLMQQQAAMQESSRVPALNRIIQRNNNSPVGNVNRNVNQQLGGNKTDEKGNGFLATDTSKPLQKPTTVPNHGNLENSEFGVNPNSLTFHTIGVELPFDVTAALNQRNTQTITSSTGINNRAANSNVQLSDTAEIRSNVNVNSNVNAHSNLNANPHSQIDYSTLTLGNMTRRALSVGASPAPRRSQALDTPTPYAAASVHTLEYIGEPIFQRRRFNTNYTNGMNRAINRWLQEQQNNDRVEYESKENSTQHIPPRPTPNQTLGTENDSGSESYPEDIDIIMFVPTPATRNSRIPYIPHTARVAREVLHADDEKVLHDHKTDDSDVQSGNGNVNTPRIMGNVNLNLNLNSNSNSNDNSNSNSSNAPFMQRINQNDGAGDNSASSNSNSNGEGNGNTQQPGAGGQQKANSGQTPPPPNSQPGNNSPQNPQHPPPEAPLTNNQLLVLLRTLLQPRVNPNTAYEQARAREIVKHTIKTQLTFTAKFSGSEANAPLARLNFWYQVHKHIQKNEGKLLEPAVYNSTIATIAANFLGPCRDKYNLLPNLNWPSWESFEKWWLHEFPLTKSRETMYYWLENWTPTINVDNFNWLTFVSEYKLMKVKFDYTETLVDAKEVAAFQVTDEKHAWNAIRPILLNPILKAKFLAIVSRRDDQFPKDLNDLETNYLKILDEKERVLRSVTRQITKLKPAGSYTAAIRTNN